MKNGNNVKRLKSQQKILHGKEPKLFQILDKIWNFLPDPIGTVIATCIIFVLGSTMRGDWLLIFVHFMKYLNHNNELFANDSKHTDVFETTTDAYDGWPLSLEAMRLQNVWQFILIDSIFSYAFYFGVCGFLNWWFYVRQRDNPETWKCQPKKWLSPDLERHEMIMGAKNVGVGSVIFGSLACYISNGGYTTLYNDWDAYGWPYLFTSIPLIFLYQDAGAYYCHRLFHIPYLYKKYHKLHHLYKHPTPYSVSAMHTTELLCFQSVMIIPAFAFPVHTVIYFGNLLYIYYYGIITHSGIDFKSMWPWQAETMFHDNHHQYFHVNFGFNFKMWDYMHDTYRRKDRVYNEDISGGKGKPLAEASEEEIKMHQEELENEIKSS